MLLLLVMPVFALALEEGVLLGRVSHVADGDSVTLTANERDLRIRLHQIDAPEHEQPGSDAARDALRSKVAGKYVRVRVETIDDYGRIVGQLWLGNRDINRELVREGHAWAYRQYLDDETLLADEAAAREARRGLWAGAEPVPPWLWRRGARRPATAATAGAGVRKPSEGCRIKGNISRRGTRIYHVPGDRHYRQTRIDTSQGERWFCSVQEAERAGWRRAR